LGSEWKNRQVGRGKRATGEKTGWNILNLPVPLKKKLRRTKIQRPGSNRDNRRDQNHPAEAKACERKNYSANEPGIRNGTEVSSKPLAYLQKSDLSCRAWRDFGRKRTRNDHGDWN